MDERRYPLSSARYVWIMVLPLYSVMKAVPQSYQKAAVSLGSHPFGAFWKVYVPQTSPGVGAGSLSGSGSPIR